MIRCRTVRQLSAQERWDTEFVLSIPDGERAGDVNIRVDLLEDLLEAGGDGGVHPPDIERPIISRRMRLTREMFERFGLTTQCLGCRAIRTGIGYPANLTERCRERIEQELEKEPEGASRVARDRERIKQARQEERSRDMRVVDPEQRPDRVVIEGTRVVIEGTGVVIESSFRVKYSPSKLLLLNFTTFTKVLTGKELNRRIA